MEHLRCHDDRLILIDAHLYDRPLDRRDILQIHLYAEVTSSDHNAVGGLYDLVDIVHALLVLYLGDDLDVTMPAVEDLLYLIDILP